MIVRLPDRIARRLIKAGKRPMDGSRSSQAASVLDMPVQRAGFDALAGHTHMLLVTYKRDGTAVPTPVWFARDGERVYVWTEINAYKAKRAAAKIRSQWGPGRRLFELLSRPLTDVHYIEFVPAGSQLETEPSPEPAPPLALDT